MTHSKDQPGGSERLVHAYDRMMERIKTAIDSAEHGARPALSQLLERAQEKAVTLGEVTQEEAERIGAYLRRDLEAVADYLSGAEAQDLVSWLKFDIELIEARLLELFMSVADPTKVELMALAERARRVGEYHTGEITGIGTLHCADCGQAVQFHATGHIPPCPKCHATRFTR
jgi:hypothetical protein